MGNIQVLQWWGVFLRMSSKAKNQAIYNADVVAGSLLVSESRQIARLMLEGVDQSAWRKAIEVENILQKRSPIAAKRQARLIKSRLDHMKPQLWEMAAHGSAEVTTQALLAATIKHTRLLGDFMDTVLRQHWRTFVPKISRKDWTDYIESCAQLDPRVLEWTDSTHNKIRQVIFRILAEARYIDSTRTLRLTPISVAPEVRRYLLDNSENYALRCMEVAQ